MKNAANKDALAQATRALALGEEQAKELRAQIAALTLRVAQHDSDAAQATALVEANGALVISALQAEETAESAMGELDEFTRVSQRDVLTGTPNRVLMLDRLKSAIALSRRRSTRAAVFFVDLDQFKSINDTLGHAVGDDVLRLVAARLQLSVRDSDTVSRHGGDEFLVLLPEIAHWADAALIAEKMLVAMKLPGPTPLPGISISIGIAICPDDGVEPEILIANADAAMYFAKQLGGGRFACHGALPADPRSPQTPHAEAADGERLDALSVVNAQLRLDVIKAQELQKQFERMQKMQLAFLTQTAFEIRGYRADLEGDAETPGRSAGIPFLLQLQKAIDAQLIRLAERHHEV